MNKLVIIDEYFVDMGGHYYEYNKAVQEIFSAHGTPAIIYANSRLQPKLQQELGAVPFFEGLPKNSLNKIPVVGPLINRIRFWHALYRKIKELYKREQSPDTVFFFTTVVWYNVLPVALAASRSKCRNVLLYRTSFVEHPGLPNALWKVGDWLYRYTFEKLKQNKNIRYCTDSDVIAAECKEKFGCDMMVLPIPHIKPGAEQEAGHKQAPDAAYSVYAPGAIREEKGIRFIASAFEYMAAIKHPLLEKIKLITQYNPSGDGALNDEIRERLNRVPVNNIFLGNLSTDEYNRQLREANIILIPYGINSGYRARTSGIMSETIAACKPFITTKNTWMSIQSDKYNTGLSVTYNSNEEFAAALEDMVNSYREYEKKAIIAKPGWLAYHSTENFYGLLNSLIGEKG